MSRTGPPDESKTTRMYREHDHEWLPFPEAVHGVYDFLIEDGHAYCFVHCQWQPTKTHSSEFRTVAEPKGPPCDEQKRVELSSDSELHPDVAMELRRAWVDGDLDVVDQDLPFSPTDSAFVVVETSGVRVRFETDQ